VTLLHAGEKTTPRLKKHRQQGQSIRHPPAHSLTPATSPPATIPRMLSPSWRTTPTASPGSYPRTPTPGRSLSPGCRPPPGRHPSDAIQRPSFPGRYSPETIPRPRTPGHITPAAIPSNAILRSAISVSDGLSKRVAIPASSHEG